ncbi:stalk domain-containing protein [Paenibacillus kobensis]|uniref:stalk domain-containing protein n=1 Tax=Paenibacillus kobensis TaxID=59841 RepID=UPI001FE78A00|nr:stalk domain-containing protein [Paenibacillus kobensis]
MVFTRKSIMTTACTALILLSGLTDEVSISSAAALPKPVTIMLDGYPLPFPVAPFVTQGTTMVPFRAIAKAINIQIDWSNATQTLTATKTRDDSTTEVILRTGDKKAKVNGQTTLLNVAPVLKNGTLFVPLSFFSTQFGAGVGWNGTTQTVSITSPIEPMYTEAFYATSSYSEVDLVSKFDAVSFGWTRLDPSTGYLILNGKDFFWPKPAGDVTPESIVLNKVESGGQASLMAAAMDGRGELTKMLHDSVMQDNTIDELVTLATDNQFTGITLDFEGLGLTGDYKEAQQSFNQFVQKLDQRAEAANLTLSLALHPLNSSFRGYDYKTLASYADEIIVMAYDYKTYTDAPEPMKYVDEAIQLALKQVPESKLVLGISMGSENAQSVNNKIGLAKRYGLKGIAIWRLGITGDAAMQAIKKSIVMN